MNTELLEALTILEKEKNISKEVLMEAIEQSLIQACKNHFGKADNVHVTIDHETCEFSVYADKTVVGVVEDPVMEISLSNAKMMDSKYELGDIVQVPIQSKQFGRIATQNAKNVILQKIREEERNVLFDQYYAKEKFVRVLDRDVCPETKWVEGSNYVDIGFKIDPRTNRIIMMGAIDNLVKGAAGQAVQNMNLLFGLPEDEGLELVPMFP